MVRCGFRRGSGLGLWLLAFVFAQAGGCDTFGDGYDEPPQVFFGNGGSTGKASVGGTGNLGSGGTIFPPDPGLDLCPPLGGTGGSFVIDGGSEAGSEAGMGGQAGAPNAGGEAGLNGGGMPGGAGEGGMSGSSGEAGMSATGGGGGVPPLSGCPAAEPQVGACAEEGIVCMYGDPINLTCRRTWTCFNGLWSSSRSCTSGQQNACPAAAPSHGSACTEPVTCAYPDGNTCDCSFCGNNACWACNGPPSRPASCPQQPPLAGTPCSTAPVECAYGECFTSQQSIIAVCCHSAWTVRDQGCPIPI